MLATESVAGAYQPLSRCVFQELQRVSNTEQQGIVYQRTELGTADQVVAYTGALTYAVLAVLPTTSAIFEVRFLPTDPLTTQLEFRAGWPSGMPQFERLVKPAITACMSKDAQQKKGSPISSEPQSR